jgi:tripartite ATP-independent transporter DctM subunit
LLSFLYIVYCLVRCHFNPSLGPPMPIEERATSYRQIIWEFLMGVIPLGAVIFAALGSILMGWATATEAGAMGAVGSLALVILYKRFRWEDIRESLYKSTQTTCMVMFLATAANIYGSVFTKLGTGELIAKWLVLLPVSPMVMTLLLMAIIFLLGWPLEWPPIVFIFVPILLPVVTALKFNMVWFGVLLAVNMQTAFLSPPVAVSSYYLKAVAPYWSMKDINIGMMHFMALQVIGLIVIICFPEIALWLPDLLYK